MLTRLLTWSGVALTSPSLTDSPYKSSPKFQMNVITLDNICQILTYLMLLQTTLYQGNYHTHAVMASFLYVKAI